MSLLVNETNECTNEQTNQLTSEWLNNNTNKIYIAPGISKRIRAQNEWMNKWMNFVFKAVFWGLSAQSPYLTLQTRRQVAALLQTDTWTSRQSGWCKDRPGPVAGVTATGTSQCCWSFSLHSESHSLETNKILIIPYPGLSDTQLLVLVFAD